MHAARTLFCLLLMSLLITVQSKEVSVSTSASNTMTSSSPITTTTTMLSSAQVHVTPSNPVHEVGPIVQEVALKADEWKNLPLYKKTNYLQKILSNTILYQDEWNRAAEKSRGIAAPSPNESRKNAQQGCARADVMTAGPATMGSYCNILLKYLHFCASHKGMPPPPRSIRQVKRRNGNGCSSDDDDSHQARTIVKLWPESVLDKLEAVGLKGELVLEGTPDQVQQESIFDANVGGVAGILGAGNFNAPIELLCEMFLKGRVCIFKPNPVNQEQFKVLAKILNPLVKEGYLNFVVGGSDVGAALVEDAKVDHVVLTGSAATYEKIKPLLKVKPQEEEEDKDKENDKPPSILDLGGAASVEVDKVVSTDGSASTTSEKNKLLSDNSKSDNDEKEIADDSKEDKPQNNVKTRAPPVEQPNVDGVFVLTAQEKALPRPVNTDTSGENLDDIDSPQGAADMGVALMHDQKVNNVVMNGSYEKIHLHFDTSDDNNDDDDNSDEEIKEKPICAELGGVNPWIVVPSKHWSRRSIDRHARHLAFSKLANNGHTCAAPQLVIVAKDWKYRQAFMDRLRHWLGQYAGNVPFYPGLERNYWAFGQLSNAEVIDNGKEVFPKQQHPILIANVAADDDQVQQELFTYEAFCPVLAEVPIECDDCTDTMAFLQTATDFCHRKCVGSLTANILIPDQDVKKNSRDFDRLIAEMPFGVVGINLWPAFAHSIPMLVWGAPPGLEDSGIGFIGNAGLYKGVQKAVVRAPFNWLGIRALSVMPPRKTEKVFRRLAQYKLRPNVMTQCMLFAAVFVGI